MEDTEIGETLLGDPEATGRPRSAPVRLERGDPLGRYVVLEMLGSGAMGVVYAAYDPELDRRVAIKLLVPALGPSRIDGQGRHRLIREAQALAQLQHPNVVTVHDVGEHEGQVFVAMEYVDGHTLRQWLDAAPRPWREIVAVMRKAGRGLQAAHAKQLVHRDFKPDNVMLEARGELDGSTPTRGDRDGPGVGRVLVMDFGLAAATGERTRDDTGPMLETSTPSLSTAEILADLTRTGAVMGTPAYMAPEQHRGQPTDARTDQFAYCVTLYEALYGERPFAGNTMATLAMACTEGRIEPAPAGARVPRWLREVVLRGLAVEPDDRWPSMAALLDALDRDPTRTRRRVAVAAVAVAVLGVGWGASVLQERRRVEQCRIAADAIDQTWNDAARAEVRDGILGTGLSYAADTWTRLEPLLDARAEQWRATRYDACIDPAALSPELQAIQVECLDAHRDALADRLEILASADASVLTTAVSDSLRTRASVCLEPAHLRSRERLPVDPDRRAEVVQLRRTITRASLLSSAGRFEDAIAVAERSLEQARALELPRQIARAQFQVGRALKGRAQFEPARLRLEDAFFEARRAGDDEAAASCARTLVLLVGSNLADTEQGRRWARHAEILASTAGIDDDGVEAAILEHHRGLVELEAGDFPEAKRRLEHAIEMYEHTVGTPSTGGVAALQALAAVYDRTDEGQRGFELQWRALELSRELYGDGHPAAAEAYNDVGASYLSLEKYDEAVSMFTRAIAIYEAAGLEGRLGAPLDNLSLAYRAQGRHELALDTSLRTLEVRRSTLPAGHPAIGNALINHGQTLEQMGKVQEALRDYAEATTIYEQAHGPEHALVGEAAYVTGTAYSHMGDHAHALDHHRRSLAIRRATLGADSRKVAWSAMGIAWAANMVGRLDVVLAEVAPLMETIDRERLLPNAHRAALMTYVGRAQLAHGQGESAIDALERALALADDPDYEPYDVALTKYVLGRALWETGRDRVRGSALVRDAVALLQTSEHDTAKTYRAWVDAWLDTHDLDGPARPPPPAPSRGAP